MADELIRDFRAFRTSEERLASLSVLVQTLNFEERLFISTSISQRNDPFFMLPLELILLVLNDFSLRGIWRLQRVCKRWHRILSLEEVLRPAVARWQTHHSSDSGRLAEGTAGNTIENDVQHIQALTIGKPITRTTFTRTGTGLQGPQPQLSHRKLDLKGRRIAYISSQQGQGDAVIVRDLVGADETTLRGAARERILMVILTTKVVAFVTFDGCLYVSRFSEHDEVPTTVQLPSSRVRAAGGDGDTIALAMRTSMQDSTSVSELLVYNVSDRRLQSFPVDGAFKIVENSARKLNSCSILVNSERETIDVFTLVSDISDEQADFYPYNKYLKVTHLRISFSGDCLRSNRWEELIHSHTSIRECQFLMAQPVPTGYRDEYRIVVCEVAFMGGLPFRPKFAVLFNSRVGKFFEDEMTKRHTNEEIGQNPGSMSVLWKGLHQRPHVPQNWLEYVSYMNDTFMVSLEVSQALTQDSRIRVFCFDPGVHMAGVIEVDGEECETRVKGT